MYRYIRSSDERHEMFERKARYAENKARDNIEKAVGNGMGQEQAEAVAAICKYRHDIHMIKGSDVYYGNDHIYDYIDKITDLIMDNDLPALKWSVNIDEDWVLYADYENGIIDDSVLSELQEEADDTGREFSDVLFEYADESNTKTIDIINKDIERWLSDIDTQYGTEFAPTGWSRLM